jgi:hypothetical protein
MRQAVGAHHRVTRQALALSYCPFDDAREPGRDGCGAANSRPCAVGTILPVAIASAASPQRTPIGIYAPLHDHDDGGISGNVG